MSAKMQSIRDIIRKAASDYDLRFRNIRGLLKAIGAVLESASTRAFEEKRLGNITWPVQYPGQEEPFLHIAGALTDLGGAGNIKPRRFKRGPQLIDTGSLSRSIKSEVLDEETIAVGSALPYAGIHQWGGTSEIPITQQMRDRWIQLILKADKAASRAARSRPSADPAKEAKRILRKHKTEEKFAALSKLGFLVDESVTRKLTRVAVRPFLGVTDEAAREVYESVVDYALVDPPDGVSVEVG